MKCFGGPLDGLDYPMHCFGDGDIVELPGANNFLKLIRGEPFDPKEVPANVPIYEAKNGSLHFVELISLEEYRKRVDERHKK